MMGMTCLEETTLTLSYHILMATPTAIPGPDPPMGLRKALLSPLYHIGNKQLVLFKHAQLMTSLTDH